MKIEYTNNSIFGSCVLINGIDFIKPELVNDCLALVFLSSIDMWLCNRKQETNGVIQDLHYIPYTKILEKVIYEQNKS